MDFVFKIGPRHCPKGHFRPIDASEWIGQQFTVPKPQAALGGVVRETVRAGDRAWLWTHHDPRQDGDLIGQGLVAVATVDTATILDGGEVGVTFSDVELRQRPLSRDVMERQQSQSRAIGHLLNHTTSRVLALSDELAGELQDAVEAEDSRFRELATSYDTEAKREWSDDELFACLMAYLEMLGKQEAGVPFTKADYRRVLLANQLNGRTDGSVEYRMQNISAFFAELGMPTVRGYLPARNVGRGVIIRLTRLFEELGDVDPTDFAPTDDTACLSVRVGRLSGLKRGYMPVGNKSPRRTSVSSTQFVRDPAVIMAVLDLADGCCERCGSDAPFLREDGSPFLEVHHIHFLSEGGPDVVHNAVALCPNCHRECHYGAERDALRDELGRLRASLRRRFMAG